MNESKNPALTERELQWLLGEVLPSKNYEAVLRHSIRVKLQTFEN